MLSMKTEQATINQLTITVLNHKQNAAHPLWNNNSYNIIYLSVTAIYKNCATLSIHFTIKIIYNQLEKAKEFS